EVDHGCAAPAELPDDVVIGAECEDDVLSDRVLSVHSSPAEEAEARWCDSSPLDQAQGQPHHQNAGTEAEQDVVVEDDREGPAQERGSFPGTYPDVADGCTHGCQRG